MARENQPIWVLANCNSHKEAKEIGNSVLSHRLGSCFDIFPRSLTNYFWPPKGEKIESAKGALLVIETFGSKYHSLHALVVENHSDELPFIGFIPIQGISRGYRGWMKGEIK